MSAAGLVERLDCRPPLLVERQDVSTAALVERFELSVAGLVEERQHVSTAGLVEVVGCVGSRFSRKGLSVGLDCSR